MKRLIIGSVCASALLIIGAAVAAARPDDAPVKRVFRLPDNVTEVAPHIFALGTARDVDGTLVEGYAIVHPKHEGERSARGSGPKPGGTTCYAFLASGAKWKTVEPYLFNPANTDGFDGATAASQLTTAIAQWESQVSTDILGTGTMTSNTLTAETTAPDGQNEVFFGPISDPNTIAVTTVWGNFGGAPQNRRLVEWDMVFNDTNYTWGDVLASSNTALMDFENIATHELGHAVGLGHPSDACTEETMYRYATYGETKKRDLNTGDIQGIKKLYQ